MFGLLNDISVQKLLGLLVVIVVFYLLVGSKTNESFEPEEQLNTLPLQVDERTKEMLIKPPYVDTDLRTIMSGSGFIPQKEFIPPWGQQVENVVDAQYGIADGLDDGAGGSLGMHYNMCSPACCSEQWPTPFKLPYDKFICNNRDKFQPSPYVCNNAWQNSGCLCMTKPQARFLEDRGTNADVPPNPN